LAGKGNNGGMPLQLQGIFVNKGANTVVFILAAKKDIQVTRG